MSIKLIQGDLLNAKTSIIAHGVNCAGGFGSGVAGAIARKWPRVKTAYLQKFQQEGWKLGNIQLVFTTEELELPLVANIATQKDYGYDGKLRANYKAIKDGLEELFKYAQMYNFSIGMPRIGCGLAGGDWTKVFSIIEKLSLQYPDVVIEIYSLPEK